MPDKYVKTYADTFLYQSYPRYEEQIFKYLMSGEVIDKTTEKFQDAKYQVKQRAVGKSYIDCMESNNVIFLRGEISQPFLVLTAKDIRGRATNEMALNEKTDKISKGLIADPEDTISGTTKPRKPNSKPINERLIKESDKVYDDNFIPYSRPPIVLKEDVLIGSPLKVFINVDMMMNKDNTLTRPDYMIAFLTSAMVNLLYYKMPVKLLHHSEYSSACFRKMFTYVIDYMAKISVMGNTKAKCEYLAYKYFYRNICNTYSSDHKPEDNFTQSVRQRCLNETGLSDREAAILDTLVKPEDYLNIKTFIEAVSEHLRLPNLEIDAFIEKWMYLFGGPKTAFGLEYFPSFSTILTDAYTGTYLNNQKTIEKVCGNDMVVYTKDVLATIS